MLSCLDFKALTEEETKQMFAEAVQYHKDWLNQILDTITSGKVWTSIVDPHFCIFGLFYDVATPRSQYEDLWPRIGEAHEKLHSTAAQLKKAYEDGTRKWPCRFANNLKRSPKNLQDFLMRSLSVSS